MNFHNVLCFYTSIPVLCFALYLHGFFPLKTTLNGYAEKTSVVLNNKSVTQPRPVFDKLVIVLIDALRSDFVFDKTDMVQLKKMIGGGRAVGFEVKAHPPTVTLPRIKAVTSGTIPGFIDVVLNFDSSSLEEDNLISQMKMAAKNLVFYGDDTWLKLFPEHFIRSDGTTSFYVSDYTEVDYNVSRHLDAELWASDWDVMILHYLGLDHIGHLEGPHSPLIGPKLQEMDEVIHRIYTSLEKQSSHSLILVCGDHGMSDHGGHGGASEKEVLVPAVFISPQFTKTETSVSNLKRAPLQIDLAPTLSVLLGLPIPKNNLGQVLQEVLEAGGVPVESVLELLYFNSLQIVKLMEANIPGYKYERSYEMFLDVTQLHRDFLNQVGSVDVKQLLSLYETMLDSMTTRISSSLTKYDLYLLTVTPVVMFLAFLGIILVIVKVDISRPQQFSLGSQYFLLAGITTAIYLSWHVLACSSNTFNSKNMCGWSLGSVLTQAVILVMVQASVASLSALLQMKARPSSEWKMNSWVTKLLLAGSVLHSLTYVSSSNVEEEHQTSYFLVTTFFSVNAVRTLALYLQHYWKLKQPASSTTSVPKHIKDIINSEEDIMNLEEDIMNSEDIMHSEDDVNSEEAYQAKVIHSDFDRNYSTIRGEEMENSHNRKVKYYKTESFKEVTTAGKEAVGDVINQEGRNVEAKDSFIDRKLQFPAAEVVSLILIIVILRFLRSLNQTGNKWLDRPDIGDWLGRYVKGNDAMVNSVDLDQMASSGLVISGSMLFSLASMSKWSDNRSVLTVAVLAAYIIVLLAMSKKFTSTEVMLTGIALFSCYRYRAKAGAIDDVFNEIRVVDRKYKNTIQYFIVCGIGVVGIFRTTLDFIFNKLYGKIEGKIKASVGVIESFQQLLLLVMCILLRTHNTIYVAGLAVVERLTEDLVPSIISLPVPYLTMFCLWMGRASFFYQGNSNSLSTIDVAAGYVGLPEYQATIVGIQLSIATYAGPIFWFIVLLKYIYLQSLRCDTGNGSPIKKLKTGVAMCILTLLLERLLTILIYTSVTTIERYHLFVWTVFSPKLLYEGAFTISVTIFTFLLVLLHYFNS